MAMAARAFRGGRTHLPSRFLSSSPSPKVIVPITTGLEMLEQERGHLQQQQGRQILGKRQAFLTLFSPSSPPSFSSSLRLIHGVATASRVIAMKTDSEFDTAMSLAQENNGLAVAYFTASWCGPCKTVAPVVSELSNHYTDVTFLKVDVDLPELRQTLKESDVSSVPTFKFYRNGKAVSQIIGANVSQLKDTIADLQKQ
eukprot:c18609_g1_i2 orf=34-630(+)